jgi:hypothetical protein
MASPGSEAIRFAADLFRNYPDSLSLERTDSSLVLKPTDGFEITIYDVGEDAMVSAERWHTHYDDPEQAAFCALWLLTPYYRIVHELKGGVLVAAWIERYEEEGWMPMDPVYFLNPESEQDWVAKPGETYTHRYLQQAVVPPPRPYREFCPGAVLGEDGLPPDFKEGSRVEVVEGPMGPGLLTG